MAFRPLRVLIDSVRKGGYGRDGLPFRGMTPFSRGTAISDGVFGAAARLSRFRGTCLINVGVP